MNITEFVDSIKLQLSDLINIGEVGYVEGISNIMIRNLKELDVTQRPIHCSDVKRETLYVKDGDNWEKDDEKQKVKKVIKNIACKNFKQINEWVQENPDAKDIESKKHEQYMRIINKSAGGFTIEEDEINYNKIIKKVTPKVTIEREKEGDINKIEK
jgi:hypothetical protein